MASVKWPTALIVIFHVGLIPIVRQMSLLHDMARLRLGQCGSGAVVLVEHSHGIW